MRELTCIVCPIGCSLSVEEGPAATADGKPSEGKPSDGSPSISISGNHCPRGVVYAQEEILAPKRVVTATCAISDSNAAPVGKRSLHAPRRVPVKTNTPCPKEKIPALLADIYATAVSLPVRAGDTLIPNWKGEGIDIVASRSVSGEGCLVTRGEK